MLKPHLHDSVVCGSVAVVSQDSEHVKLRNDSFTAHQWISLLLLTLCPGCSFLELLRPFTCGTNLQQYIRHVRNLRARVTGPGFSGFVLACFSQLCCSFGTSVTALCGYVLQLSCFNSLHRDQQVVMSILEILVAFDGLPDPVTPANTELFQYTV